MPLHVIGTAGHVDHGKSTLVHALTGIDPDRLIEEKEREMTIDLGFAWLRLGDDEVGIIDVPGHRDFIENMLAGVGGIDLALFVIAADEGVMPQTREHLAILDLLEVERAVVALTKLDLVDDQEWLDMVILEIADVLAGTILHDSPIIPVSARTGQGLDELKQTLLERLNTVDSRPDLGRPRLAVDRVFSLPGFGTIVTGTLLDGSFHAGDTVEIFPGGMSARIRGLQTHKTRREVARPGSRVAINLTGVERQQLRRGQVVALPGVLRETRLIDTVYRHLPDLDSPLKHNAEVKVYLGADEVFAHVRLIGRDQLSPGEEGWIQLALATPMVASRGDRFILRRPSPGMTIGGGRVIDPNPGKRHRRFKADVIEQFRSLVEDTPEERLHRTIGSNEPILTSTLKEKSAGTPESFQAALERLLAEGLVINFGKYLLTPSGLDALKENVLTILEKFHQSFPLRLGIERELVRSDLKIPAGFFPSLIELLASEGQILEERHLLRLPGHRIRFSADQDTTISKLMVDLDRLGANSPSVKECKNIVGDEVYYALVDTGQLIPISSEVVYSAGVYQTLVSKLVAYLSQRGSITAAEVRDLLGTSRKYAIAILEHLDDQKFTRRVGDSRELVKQRTSA
jgi:selenocysteine-specific elongation factor